MEQIEAIGVAGRVAGVEGLDTRARRAQNRPVFGHVARRGVGKVTQDRKIDMRVEVCQCDDLKVLESLVDR